MSVDIQPGQVDPECKSVRWGGGKGVCTSEGISKSTVIRMLCWYSSIRTKAIAWFCYRMQLQKMSELAARPYKSTEKLFNLFK